MASIVFLDSRVEQKESLISSFSADTEYYLLYDEFDGIAQIADVLAAKSDYSSIHIISHGSPGSITIGSTLLDDSTLDGYADALAQIGHAFQANADLLLYGCNVGAGDAGQQFVEHLSQLTGLDIAASNDPTGGAIAGGDWALEVQAGAVETHAEVSAEYTTLLGNHAPNISISAPTTISFAPKIDYTTGEQPVSVTSTDIDGDGYTDLLVANQLSNTVSVLKNNGNGTFAEKIDYAAGDEPYSLTSADIDGDGDTDLLVANEGRNTVSVLKNNGNGTFGAKVDYITGFTPVSVTSADIDGDGDADMLVANVNDYTVSVLKNNGFGTFAEKVDYAIGNWTTSVISADIDNDGDADILVANESNEYIDTISVLKNNGNGTFAAKVDYAVGDNPESLISNDVDGDGDVDVIVANLYSNTVSVLKNNGNGTFAAKVDYATGYGPISLTIADVDGDGHADVLVLSEVDDTVSVLKNNGNGTFATKVDYATGYGPYSVTSADVDGDGDADLIVANSSNNTVSVLLNTSTSALSSVPVAPEQTSVLVSPAIVISDPDGAVSWNGGTLQVQVVAHAEAADSLFLPTANPGGSGIWLHPSGNLLMAGTTQIGIADAASVSADTVWTFTFNANAANNALVQAPVQAAARAIRFINSSDDPGTDERTVQFTVTDKEGETAHVDQAVNVEAVNDAPTLTVFSDPVASTNEDTMVGISVGQLLAKGNEADVDGTVTGFVVKSVTSGTLRIGADAASATAWGATTNNLIDATHQAWWTPDSSAQGIVGAFSLVAVDNSGAKSQTAVEVSVDVVSVNQAPNISIPAPTTISFATSVDYATGDSPTSVTCADVDGDGAADIIVANLNSDTLSVLKNNGNGTFAEKVDYATGDYPRSVISDDVDGDGDADLLFVNYSNTVSVLKNNGNGTFAEKVDYATGDYPLSVTIADIDGDGDGDALVANHWSNTVSVLKNNGNGTFEARLDYVTGLYPVSVTSADVDDDGDVDVIVANEYSNTVSVLKNNGNGTFTAKADYATGDRPESVISADVDGDGDADMIVSNLDSNTVSVLKNNGNGTFAAKVDYATGEAPISVTSADVDRDGNTDIIALNEVGDPVSVLKNNGNGTFAAKVDYGTGYGPYSVTSADVDGDGDPDVIVANWGNATVSVLLNTSTSALSSVPVAPEQTSVLVSPAIVINDPDGDASWNGGTLQVQVVTHAEMADSLFLPATNPGGTGIWLDPSGNLLMVGTTQIGTADAASVSNNAVWALTFNANATNALVQEVARSMQFTNSSDDPGTDERVVRFTVTDKEGETAHVDQAVRVEAVNDAPTGEVTITGTPIKGDTLTVDTSDLSDADGLGTFTYHWYADGVAITGVTGETYLLTEAEVGKAMTVDVSYTDGHGTAEHVTSEATDEVLSIAYTLDGTVTFWKSGAPVEGVAVALESGTVSVDDVSGPDGQLSFDGVIDGEYELLTLKMPDESVERSVAFSDVLAALKLSFGMNPNRDGSAVSNYQYLAADVNHDGKVKVGDAFDILKMVVGLDSAPASEWLFFGSEIGDAAMSRSSVEWPTNSVLFDQDTELDLVGVIRGDIDGSWTALAV
jgi:large repetitive protein